MSDPARIAQIQERGQAELDRFAMEVAHSSIHLSHIHRHALEALTLRLVTELIEAQSRLSLLAANLKGFHLCDEHQSDRWESDGTCPICEGHRLAAQVKALEAPQAQGWQPMETMPEKGQVIVCWRRRRLNRDAPDYDIIDRREYIEIVGYGEPPAIGWMSLPGPLVKIVVKR